MDYNDLIIILFLSCFLACIVFSVSLNQLAFYKKIFWIYKNQIEENGEIIKKPSFWQLNFDFLIIEYAFYTIPKETENPDIYRFKEIKSLRKQIIILTRLLKFSIILAIILVATLIILIRVE